MVMPTALLWSSLSRAAQNGSLPQSRLDDMATRIIATWYFLDMDSPSYPSKGIGMPKSVIAAHRLVNAIDPASKRTLFQSAVEGHVLVKNTNNALPLKKPALLSLFGYDAHIPLSNNPGGFGLDKWTLGFGSANIQDAILPSIMAGGLAMPQAATAGTLISGGGSGSNTGPYISSPHEAFQQQAYEDGTYLLWDLQSNDPYVSSASDACIVFINEFALEGVDRTSLADPASDKLVSNVARNCTNTMVVIHNAGIRLVDNWIDNPNVTAVIFAHLPGQDSGRALVEVMYGKQSPSGRLPYTVAKKESDYGDVLAPATNRNSESLQPNCNTIANQNR
jgi:beta-glucosidase